MSALALVRNGRWKVRVIIFLVMIVPLYIIPAICRALLPGILSFIVGVLTLDPIGCLLVGLLTNNYHFTLWLYLACATLELILFLVAAGSNVALWIGGLIPALVAIYFAQRLYINMGD